MIELAKIRELTLILAEDLDDAALEAAWLKFSVQEFSDHDGIAVTKDTARRFQMWRRVEDLPEVKRLKADLAAVEAQVSGFDKERQELVAQLHAAVVSKNDAYAERAMVLGAMAKVLEANGYTVGLGRHEPAGDPDFEGFETVFYAELPGGQVGWHIADGHVRYFADVPTYLGKYDGHTVGEKYNRLNNFFPARRLKEREDERVKKKLAKVKKAIEDLEGDES